MFISLTGFRFLNPKFSVVSSTSFLFSFLFLPRSHSPFVEVLALHLGNGGVWGLGGRLIREQKYRAQFRSLRSTSRALGHDVFSSLIRFTMWKREGKGRGPKIFCCPIESRKRIERWKEEQGNGRQLYQAVIAAALVTRCRCSSMLGLCQTRLG